MSTLSNVTATKNHVAPSVGFTPTAIPEAKSSDTGVSVEYVQDKKKKWFVFRASYNREDMAADMLINAGVYAYVVKRYRWREVNRRPKKVLETLIPNIVFAYLTPHKAEIFTKDNQKDEPSPCPKLATFLTYYYNHFKEDAFGKNPPLEVSPAEMESFILGTCTHHENLMVLKKNDYRFKTDEEVLVCEGEFKGVRGRVIRAHGQQRVLIRLTDFADIATAYIPSAFLQV